MHNKSGTAYFTAAGSGRTADVWVGASGEKRSLPMVAKYADAWHCFGGVDYLAPKNRVVDGLCEAADRDPSTLLRAASVSIEGLVDDTRREIDAWREAGFGYLIAGWPSTGREQVETFAAVLSEV